MSKSRQTAWAPAVRNCPSRHLQSALISYKIQPKRNHGNATLAATSVNK